MFHPMCLDHRYFANQLLLLRSVESTTPVHDLQISWCARMVQLRRLAAPFRRKREILRSFAFPGTDDYVCPIPVMARDIA